MCIKCMYKIYIDTLGALLFANVSSTFKRWLRNTVQK